MILFILKRKHFFLSTAIGDLTAKLLTPTIYIVRLEKKRITIKGSTHHRRVISVIPEK